MNGKWRAWLPYAPNGTFELPNSYGKFAVAVQVRDAAANLSAVRSAGALARTAPETVALRQVDNSGARSCGSADGSPCSDVARKFRATITSAVLPDTDLLLKGARRTDGAWVDSSASPMQRVDMTGPTVNFGLAPALTGGLWRFRVEVPQDPESVTGYAGSGWQYLAVTDTGAPAVTGASVALPDPASRNVQFALSAKDDASAVTQMRAAVNGNRRDWVPFASSGTVILPDGYGTFGVSFPFAASELQYLRIG